MIPAFALLTPFDLCEMRQRRMDQVREYHQRLKLAGYIAMQQPSSDERIKLMVRQVI